MKVNCTARYTVWFDLDIDAEDEAAAMDQLLEFASKALDHVPGVIETDLGDCETASLEDV